MQSIFTVKHFYLFLILSFTFFLSFGQRSVSGHVFDEITHKPLYGVSIYFDGTTIGTTTNDQGYFTISFPESIQSNLVFGYLGYFIKTFNVGNLNDDSVIYLKENREFLDTVHLEADSWSRAKKMAIFKREFLGPNGFHATGKILNEDDIQLVYSSSENVLRAYADTPINIRNKYLGYDIMYNMQEFEANVKEMSSGKIITSSMFMEGSSFFKEINEEPKKRHLKARKREYSQSVLYFMRSLANKNLKKNKFQIYYKGVIRAPYKYFDITKKGEDTHVVLKKKRLYIIYKKKYRSFITILKGDKEFVIDKYGNHSSSGIVHFGGVMGNKRILTLLPLDYSL